jgi:hypothetical protein
MKKMIIVLVTVVLLFSCNNANKNVEPVPEKPELVFPATIKVDEARSNNEIPLLSEFADDISYIKLKTPPNTFIKGIGYVRISKENIFILENQIVMVFDRAGNYIRTIGRIGRGPNEYVYLRSFCVVKNDGGKDELIFYTGPEGDVYRYNVNGDVIDKLFTYRFADYIGSIGDKLLLSGFITSSINLPDNITQFASTDFKGQIIDSKLLPIYSVNNWEQQFLLFPGNFWSNKFDNILLLSSRLEDTIFQVNGSGKIEPRYILDFGENGVPNEKRYSERQQIELINTSIRSINPPAETGNNVWFKFAFKEQEFLLRYDKNSQKAFTFFCEKYYEIDPNRGSNKLEGLGLVNDIDGGPDFFPIWTAYDGSSQVCINLLQVFDLKNELTPEYFINREIKFPDKKDSLIKLVNSLEDTDDYVLMLVELK